MIRFHKLQFYNNKVSDYKIFKFPLMSHQLYYCFILNIKCCTNPKDDLKQKKDPDPMLLQQYEHRY